MIGDEIIIVPLIIVVLVVVAVVITEKVKTLQGLMVTVAATVTHQRLRAGNPVGA